MSPEEFANRLESAIRDADRFMRREMPVIAGRMAKSHFQDNFRLGGFVDNGLHPWPEARRRASGGPGAAARFGTLLSARNHLYDSIDYTPGDYRVRVFNAVHYAPVHNNGGEIPRTDGMRRYAWHRFFQACGVSPGETGISKRHKTSPEAVKANPDAGFWKGMALSRKPTVGIPRRQFLGESRELRDAVDARIEKGLEGILGL